MIEQLIEVKKQYEGHPLVDVFVAKKAIELSESYYNIKRIEDIPECQTIMLVSRVTADELRSANKSRELTEVRAVISAVLRIKYTLTLRGIGILLNRKHDNIMYLLSKVDYWCECDKNIKNLLELAL